ncbi:MAG: TIGR02186 family protein [Alphaproteobacteria bacterium]|nr:TIGR02186 family protein [Alphaproteobacteria bacterium]
MIRFCTIAFLAMFAALPLRAEEVVAGLSQNRISITTNFDGSEILIFGAVKREATIPEGEPLEVIITVAGPSEPVVVRKKDRRFGIWINTAAVEVDSAPSFYSVATSAPWEEVVTDVEDLRHKISVTRAIRSVGAPSEVRNSETFTEALIRIREADDLYQTNINSVDVSQQTLFSTSVQLPANLTEGDYVARFFLTRGGVVLDQHETTIFVQKVGLERFLYNLAHEQPLVYGLLSLFIAIVAGWGASTFFRYLRG